MLRDSVRGFLAEHWPSASAVEQANHPAELRKIWKKLANQGVVELGGDPAGGGLRELLAVMQELGRAACPVPLADAAALNLLRAQRAISAPTLIALIDRVPRGDAMVCVTFGDADPEHNAGSVRIAQSAGAGGSLARGTDGTDGVEGTDDTISGQCNFVDGAAAATHLLVFVAGGTKLVRVAADAAGVTITPTRAMGANGLCRVDFANAPACVVAISPDQVRDLISVSRLAHAARATGAADRSFELAVAYAKDRKQFGQPIGRYQALQHKLATNLIALNAVQLSLDNAALHYDRRDDRWRPFAAAAFAYTNMVLRQVSLQTHHAFGAIGYAEDHEAPRHFKRVHLDVAVHGGGRAAREELAARYLGDHDNELPQFDLGAAANRFRQEVRTWLAKHWSAERREAYECSPNVHREFDAQFARELGKTGWIALSWPKRFGGQERTPFELMAFLEEMTRADAPRAGAPIQAASWMDFGKPEQQQRYLPEIASGEVMYGMWYSEPNSGSDLASLRTRAVRDGDHWVINGQKIWTTTYWGDYMWLAARTDPDAKPAHAGISMFIVRTDTPGITRTPIKTMYDGEFCNTFFDDVRIPADALVGEVNGGWQVLTGSLGVERAYVGGNVLMKIARQFEELCEYIRSATVNGKPLRDDAVVRDLIGGYAAQIEAGRQLARHCVAMLARGETPTYEAAITKVFAGELMEQFFESALDILGMEATLSAGSAGAPLRGHLEQKLRHSLMWVISLGTNEIQRSLIAQRALGLPR